MGKGSKQAQATISFTKSKNPPAQQINLKEENTMDHQGHTARRSISSQLISAKNTTAELLAKILDRHRTVEFKEQARKRFELAPVEELKKKMSYKL